MAKFDIKTVKPKFVVTTSPDNKIDVVVNKPIITSKNTKSFFRLKNTGGPRGLKGEQGDPGQDATIEVVSTTTGAAGTNASVVNQGTASAAQLAFTIPRGDKGETGAAGYSPTAAVNKVGDTATITITDKNGTTTASVSDGQDGAAGAPGQAATIAISSTETLPAGSPATVENVGSSSQASLAFGIPQGVAGQDGADGFSPTATITQTSSGATISITDKDGTTTADVSNGTDGTDGFSPVATVTPTTTGATISVTDAQGTTTADVTNGADGQAATIAVGTVTTLQPNESAYVTNVGTSSQAIFDIGIPQGQKGESGSGSGDMLAADYDPSSTVKNAGGIPNYVSGQLPGDMTGATSSTAGAHGLVPAPAAGDQAKYLKGDGTWANTPAPELVEMAYGESNAWAKFIAAYNAHCVVYCRASSNANPATGSQTRKAFMAYVNNADSPTSVEFQYYRSVSSHSDSQQGDQVFVYALTNSDGGTWSVTTRNAFSKVVAGTNMTSSYSSGTLTLNATQPTVNNATLTITQNGTSAGTFTANSATDATIALTDTTYNAMIGASSSTAGASGLVPAPAAGDEDKVLKGDGTWGEVAGSEVILYVNKSQYDLNITSGSSAFTIYTDSGYTTAATLSTITDATSAGQTVTIKTNDSCEMKVLGDLGTGGYQETYFSAVLANNRGVGKLTYSGPNSDWTFNPGSVVETPGSGVLTITQNGTSAGTFSANASSNSTIALTDTTYSAMTGATSGAAGTSGLVPAPAAGDESKVLSGAGTWVSQTAAQVNSDWNAVSGVAQILNKPTIITPLDIYPVGAIYMSVNNTNPGTLFGGTWEQIKDRFILAAGTTYVGGATGGAATINLSHSHTVDSHNHSLPANTGSHTLTVDQIPAHTHGTGYQWNTGAGTARWGVSDSLSTTAATSSTGGGKGHSHTIGGNTGSKSPGTNSQLSSSQSILPPYLAVYVWKRTA